MSANDLIALIVLAAVWLARELADVLARFRTAKRRDEIKARGQS